MKGATRTAASSCGALASAVAAEASDSSPAPAPMLPPPLRREEAEAVGRAAGLGTIVDIVPTGGSWIVELDVDGSRFFAIATENPRKAAGETTHFWVERQHLHLFDRDRNRIAL